MRKALLFCVVICFVFFAVSCDLSIEELTDIASNEESSESVNAPDHSTNETQTVSPEIDESEDNDENVPAIKIPELVLERLEYTMELTETVYTTSSDSIKYILRSKQPGGYLSRGDQWILYRTDGDKITVIGTVKWEIAIEYEAPSETEYIVKEESLLIRTLCGKDNLDVGKYCLTHYVQAPDENGNYHDASGANLYFEVIE